MITNRVIFLQTQKQLQNPFLFQSVDFTSPVRYGSMNIFPANAADFASSDFLTKAFDEESQVAIVAAFVCIVLTTWVFRRRNGKGSAKASLSAIATNSFGSSFNQVRRKQE